MIKTISADGSHQNNMFYIWVFMVLGILICFEYLNDDLRNRLISACDVIIVPQTNPSPDRFYNTAKNDLNNPLCGGNKAYIMVNGIFRIGEMKNYQFVTEKKEILGGSSGVILTLDKDLNRMINEGIITQKEQFVLFATINLQYYAARDIQMAPESIKTSVVPILEEEEIRLIKKENIRKKDAKEFLALLNAVRVCTSRNELKSLIEGNRSLIEKYSALMYERTSNLNNLNFEEIKKKCQSILIPITKYSLKSFENIVSRKNRIS